jgi:hypothetical protein
MAHGAARSALPSRFVERSRSRVASLRRARLTPRALPRPLCPAAAVQANYNGRDLPEADKWRALQRVRTGDTKTKGVVDIFYVTSDEPPKCVTRGA